MKLRDTKHGFRFVRDGAPIDVVVIYDDPTRGTWLLLGTDDAAVEIRVTPAGRKVVATPTHLRPRQIAGDDR